MLEKNNYQINQKLEESLGKIGQQINGINKKILSIEEESGRTKNIIERLAGEEYSKHENKLKNLEEQGKKEFNEAINKIKESQSNWNSQLEEIRNFMRGK